MKGVSVLLALVFTAAFPLPVYPSGNDNTVISTTVDPAQDAIAREITLLLGKSWVKWQRNIFFRNVEIESSKGSMSAGNIKGPLLTASGILSGMDGTDMSPEHILCLKAVAEAIGKGMSRWQRGYYHDNIPFPQGASCSYTLPPSKNFPVTLSSGASIGDNGMTEEALYGYMLYRNPDADDEVLIVMEAAARAFSMSFEAWKERCYIAGVRGSGGIAPAPAPMGTGPGPVRGARGSGGKLWGPPLDTVRMYEDMIEHIRANYAAR